MSSRSRLVFLSNGNIPITGKIKGPGGSFFVFWKKRLKRSMRKKEIQNVTTMMNKLSIIPVLVFVI